MRKYENKKGETVELSDEHIETSIRIKIELQNASPSQRCSWKQHKELMESEGFYDSENSEGYRQLVKSEQKKRGLLPSTQKYVDFVTDKKLESLKSVIGENYMSKRQLARERQLFNKMKRDVTDNLVLHEEIVEAISNISIDIPNIKPLPTPEISGTEAVSVLSDLHIGLKSTDEMGKEAQKMRLDYLLQETIKYYKLFNVQHVTILDLGDEIENSLLHKPTSTATTWGHNSDQFATYVKWIFEYMTKLSAEFKVTYVGNIMGNHSRLGEKGENLNGDSYSKMATNMLTTLIDSINNPNLNYDLSGYEHTHGTFTVKGYTFLAEHGDLSKQGTTKLTRYSSALDKKISYVLTGHIHNFRVETENHGRKVFTSGSLNFSNDYSRNLGFYTNGSQMIILVDEHGAQPINIDLEHVREK